MLSLDGPRAAGMEHHSMRTAMIVGRAFDEPDGGWLPQDIQSRMSWSITPQLDWIKRPNVTAAQATMTAT
jgi:hypothetical protein